MRFRPVGLLLFGLIVAASACSDATAPASFAVPRDATASRGVVATIVWSDPYAGAPSTTYVVTIDPTRANEIAFGPHSLDIPEKSICAANSGPGMDVFDRDCQREGERVTITAIVRESADGLPRIDMTPQLRFTPKRTVTLSLFVRDLTKATAADHRIIYCATETMDQCVDESLLDHSLRTRTDKKRRSLFRRIKHLSGYFVES